MFGPSASTQHGSIPLQCGETCNRIQRIYRLWIDCNYLDDFPDLIPYHHLNEESSPYLLETSVMANPGTKQNISHCLKCFYLWIRRITEFYMEFQSNSNPSSIWILKLFRGSFHNQTMQQNRKENPILDLRPNCDSLTLSVTHNYNQNAEYSTAMLWWQNSVLTPGFFLWLYIPNAFTHKVLYFTHNHIL